MNQTMKCKIFVLLFVLVFQTAVKAQTVTELQNIGDSLYVRSESLWQHGDTIGANREMEKSISAFYKINSGDNFSFVTAEYIHAVRLNMQNENLEALRLLEDADSRIKRLMPIVTELSCLIEYSLAKTYKDISRYDDAMRVGESVRTDYGMLYGVTSEKYLDALNLLSLISYSAKNYPRCKDVTREFLSRSIREGFFNENNFSDCYSLVRLADSESVLGNYAEAEDCYHIADTLLAKMDNIDEIRAVMLNRRATNLTKMGNNVLADSCLSAALELDGESSISRVMTINNHYAMLTVEDPLGAYNMFLHLVRYLEENGYQSSSIYAIVKSNLAYSCLLSEKTDEGISNIDHALTLLSENSDFSDINYLISLQTRVLLYMQKRDINMVEKYSGELSREINRHLRNVFPLLTERQRMEFWSQMSEWYGFTLPFLTMECDTGKLRGECYDAILQSRGILLNSTLNIDRILRNTEDDEMKELYLQWKTAKNRKMGTYVTEGLEKKIMVVLPSHGDFLSDMSINTDSIKKYLNYGEIAVEFVSVIDPELGDTIYLALSLMKDYAEPHLTVMCRSGEITAAMSESFCNTKLYDLLWKKMEKEMKVVKNVFFAVDGILHNIPIEYCPDETGLSMFDKYRCCRVSSTREIVKNRARKGTSLQLEDNGTLVQGKVVLYGDIDYDSYGRQDGDIDNVELADTAIVDTINVSTRGYRSLVKGKRSAVTSFSQLDGTRRELLSIEQVLVKNGIKPEMRIKDEATEATVYDIANSHPYWLHFATHGYYETEDMIVDYGMTADVENVADTKEAMALSRAALVFSGANMWVDYGEKSYDGLDGLLTAYELSSQDFSSVEMVVMSACESGLGDIGSEGVFGLQRGMKKAGVKSMMMSLCKVDDDATTLFMTTFYKKMMEGKDKLRALSEAQEVVRKAENGKWASPEFWASFIMLDGF